MEYRIKDYQISGNSIVLPRATSIEDIRLIYNETQKVLICSTAKKDNLSGLGVIIVNQFNNTTTINVSTSICVLQPNDLLTIKCDYGDDLSSVESKVEEVGNKIDNIKLPEIDTTELAKETTLQEVSSKLDNLNVEVDLTQVAKQGSNLDATNSAIYALLSQFGESVLQEAVTIICNCAEDIAWEEYGVTITYADGTSQSLPMSENGTCSFSVKIGQEYSVQLPVIGAYIAPTKKTYTASTSSRQIYWSYVVSGVFGLDELGRRYTLEQIEALVDKSIIKYGGYTDEYLENSQRDDGTIGNGFMWVIDQEVYSGKAWSSKAVEMNTDLLPFVTNNESSLLHCNGEAYTRYILAEATRLGISTPAAQVCYETTTIVDGKQMNGFLGSYQQYNRVLTNRTILQQLYSILSIEIIGFFVNGGVYVTTSNQSSAEKYFGIYTSSYAEKNGAYPTNKTATYINVFPLFPLLK